MCRCWLICKGYTFWEKRKSRWYWIINLILVLCSVLWKIASLWRFWLSFPYPHRSVDCSQFQCWLTKHELGVGLFWKWLNIWAWSMQMLMIFPSWRRKVNIVLFLQTTLSWSTKMFVLDISIVIRSYDLLKSESYDSIHG